MLSKHVQARNNDLSNRSTKISASLSWFSGNTGTQSVQALMGGLSQVSRPATHRSPQFQEPARKLTLRQRWPWLTDQYTNHYKSGGVKPVIQGWWGRCEAGGNFSSQHLRKNNTTHDFLRVQPGISSCSKTTQLHCTLLHPDLYPTVLIGDEASQSPGMLVMSSRPAPA